MKKISIIGMFFLNIFLLNATSRNIDNNMKASEKIYAVMITGKDDFHKILAEKSIQSFLEQTYPNKHLIIINDGNYSFSHLKSEIITEIKLKEKYVLGQLRNIGITLIPNNGIYLQWDDDDWHHPDLMKEQYQYMKSHRVDGCILMSQVIYCFRINAAWISSRESGIEGTVMCRRKIDVFYPEQAKSEDSIFLRNYAKKYKLIKWDNPVHYYLRFVHGHNTWDDNHFKLEKHEKDLWNVPQAGIDHLSRVIPLYTEALSPYTKPQQ